MNSPNGEPQTEKKSIVSEMKDAVLEFMVEHSQATGAIAIVMGGVGIALSGESAVATYTGLASMVLGAIKAFDKTPLEKAFEDHPEDMPGTNRDGRDNPVFRKNNIRSGI